MEAITREIYAIAVTQDHLLRLYADLDLCIKFQQDPVRKSKIQAYGENEKIFQNQLLSMC